MFNSREKEMFGERQLNKIGPELNFASTEAYNFLRTNLAFSFPNKTGCKLIGVTSSTPAEGKSFTAVNLSYSLAEAGNRVLLIDGDLRRPSIAKILQCKPGAGLSNYLADGNSRIINHGVLSENMNVIFSGDIPPNPSELIGSKKMQAALMKISEKFDYIFVDLPPVNSVSDPLVVSKYLDGVIIVVRHNFAHRSEVIETVRQLQYVNAHILGFVYNGYVHGEGNYSYKGDYGRKHYYYSSDAGKKKSDK